MNNNYKYVFSEPYALNGFSHFNVSFPISGKLKSLFDLMNSWVEKDDKWRDFNKKELIKYISITLRKKSREADLYLDIENENVNNRNVDYKEVNWLLDGITNYLPEVAYWAIDAVPEYMFKTIPGAQRALLLDMYLEGDNMVISFKTDKKMYTGADKVVTDMTSIIDDITEAVKNL